MFDFIRKLFKAKPDLVKLVQEGALIVDVRTKSEYQAAHVEGSVNIPLSDIRREVRSLKQLNKPVISVCRSGNRSGMAKSILTSADIEVYNGSAWADLKKQLKKL